ncbi:hypothetical protein [Scytonema sp. NUACC26]|uniref:hypothetical protein n=1 Tax=Scytonema sp. NUACC26 TaxID=3140176 RepID=UPI0034DC5E1B
MEVKYVSFDGREFSDELECLAWENENTRLYDKRILDKFDDQVYYYMPSYRTGENKWLVHRVKLIDIQDQHNIEWGYDENKYIPTKKIETVLTFQSIDEPKEPPFECWTHEQLPVRNLQDLFPFDLQQEVGK